MKKALLTTLGVAALGMASYAETFMQVKTADGKIVKFDVEDVTEVDFMTEEIPTDTTPASSHAYVDLGLPSGTLWATYNIGATKPEEFGDYFAWGETEQKEEYTRWTYKWGWDEISKYNSEDGLTTLLSEDDAATANWGEDWRMPTPEEQQELIDNCQYEWTEVNGVKGAKFTASNGKSIFLPAAGYRDGSDVRDVDYTGNCWSSSRIEKHKHEASFLVFGEKDPGLPVNYRYYGCSVRAVRAKK